MLPSGRIKPNSVPVTPRKQGAEPERGFWGALFSYMGLEGGEENKRYQMRQPHKLELPKQDNEAEWVPLKDGCVVAAIVLSLWDNISGPRVEQVWFEQTTPHDFLKQFAPFTLNGEMMMKRDTNQNYVEHKTLFLSDYFASSLIFSAPFKKSLTAFSLSLVFKRKYMEKYFTTHQMVTDRMTKMVTVYRLAMGHGTPESAITTLTSTINLSIRSISGLFHSSYSPTPFQNTFFGYPTLSDAFIDDINSSGSSRFPPKQQLSAVETQQHTDFLIQVISSHLQTGCTLILGPSAEVVSQWLSTLCLFLLPSQLPLVKSKLGMNVRDFVPDLALQGIVTDQKIQNDMIIKSMSPTTIVDLHQHTVEQTPPYNEYLIIRNGYQEEHSKRLAKVPSNGSLWGATEKLYRDIQPSGIVKEIVMKAFHLPAQPTYLREGYISQSISLLARRAVVFIKYITAVKEDFMRRISSISDNKNTPNPKFPAMKPTVGNPSSEERRRSDGHIELERSNPGIELKLIPAPGETAFNENHYREIKRQVKSSNDISDIDFLVLLGIAEKILPGTYVNMTGNPAWTEEKFVRNK